MFGETRPPAQRHPRHPETQPGHQMPQRRRRVRGSHIFTSFDRCVAGSLSLLLRKCQGSGCAWGREQCPCKQSRKYGNIIISLSKVIESNTLAPPGAPATCKRKRRLRLTAARGAVQYKVPRPRAPRNMQNRARTWQKGAPRAAPRHTSPPKATPTMNRFPATIHCWYGRTTTRFCQSGRRGAQGCLAAARRNSTGATPCGSLLRVGPSCCSHMRCRRMGAVSVCRR